MKVKCFVHTDLDGIGCTILAYLAFGKENVDVEYCNYTDVNKKVSDHICNLGWQNYDKTYITDISITDDLAIIINETNELYNVKLFDHHPTALMLNEYDWCTVQVSLPEAPDRKTCGTELFCKYLFENDKIITSYEYFYHDVERFVNYVRDWDTWRWKELGEGGLVSKKLNDMFDIYGREKFIDWTIKRIYYPPYPTAVFPCFDETDELLLELRQKEIDDYVKRQNLQMDSLNDKFGYVFGVVFADRYISELGNKLCELNPDLDYVAIINMVAGTVSYRTTRDELDLGGTIAHSYGGGGHAKAAGSTFSRDLALKDLSELIFSSDPFNEW
nr:hypothetical protein [uncultured Mediterraneibacter sp.]